MDVHRCRFVRYPPSTINALAFSHSQLSSQIHEPNAVRLAVGRGNGDIEIWNPLNGSWVQETIIRGGKDRSIDGLVWIQDPVEVDGNGKTIPGQLRLFSIGYTTTITEWDLKHGRPLRQSSGNHGEIWCLTAQPPFNSSKETIKSQIPHEQDSGQDLIAGCIDGAIVLYSTADDGLALKRILARPSSKKAKIVSAAFQNRTTVVVGCSNSTICVYDTTKGALLRTMSLGDGAAGGPKETIVWTLKCLQNGDIVSGDSAGELRIWNGRNYSLTQRIQSHKQDILSLALSADGTTIFSGGMDRRTVVYKHTLARSDKARWAVTSQKRFHRHDVKAMTSFEGKGMSVVASGGPDASPIIIPLKEFGREHQRTLPFLPQDPAVQCAPTKRLVMGWWEREVHLWRFQSGEAAVDDIDTETTARSRKLVAKIILKGEANITSASISRLGDIVAISTAAEIKLFHLRSQGDRLILTKLDGPKILRTGARIVQFSPDGCWLCLVRMDSTVAIARLLPEHDSYKILPRASKVRRLGRGVGNRHAASLGEYSRTVNRVGFSFDSKILAVSDLSGYIDTWVLAGDEEPTAASILDDLSEPETDSESEDLAEGVLGQQWMCNPSSSLIPQLPSPAVVLSFRPSSTQSPKSRPTGSRPPATRNNPNPTPNALPAGEDRLFVVTSSSDVLEFEVHRGGLSAWSRNNPTSHFPESFRLVRDQAMGCLWDISDTRERIWLYGSSWLWMFDLSRNIFAGEARVKRQEGEDQTLVASDESRKRKRDDKHSKHLSQGTSGAGSKIADSQLELGMSRRFQILTDRADLSGARKDMREANDVSAGDVDMALDEEWCETYADLSEHMDDENDLSSVERLQRQGDDPSPPDTTSGDQETTGDDRGTSSHWHTFKYRPVLGMVSLDAESEPANDEVEVVIIERPLWEVDLPPRYYGDLEWEKRGI